FVFLFQAEDRIRDRNVTGVQTCALPISVVGHHTSFSSIITTLTFSCTQNLMLEENNIFIEVDFMYKKIITLLIIIQIFIFYFIYEQNTMETIKYFPKDPHVTMAEASSVVELHNNKLQINVQ